MRVLVSTTANDGHFGPLVPFGRALLAAGHEVRIAAPRSFARAVATAGFDHAPFADAPPELIGPVMGGLSELTFEEADATVVREVFARIDAQAALPGLVATIEEWRPDVVLREPAELGSLAAAEGAGVPQVQVAIGMQETLRYILGLIAEPLDELAALVGVPEDRLRAVAEDSTSFTMVTEALDRAGDDGYRDDLTTHAFGVPPVVAESSEDLPSWGDPDLPLVYVTFGSVTGSLPPFAGVFREALDALADQPVRVLMTVGRGFDLAPLGPPPPNARVEQWWPQAQVLEQSTAVLGHGGFGTTMGALLAGVPQVVMPIFTSDQVVNGRHLAAAGAGRTVGPGPGLVERACAELARVLADASYGETARALADDHRSLPSCSEAVALLEALAASTG